MKNLEGKVVLITGAGSGIGREMALVFASEKARLVLVDLRQPGLDVTVEDIKRSYGAEVHTFLCDVSNRTMVYEVAKVILEKVGTVDVLVNNAGIVSGGDLLDIPDDLIVRTMEINCLAHFWMVKAFLPTMLRKDSGHIVSIASAAGLVGSAGLTDYCASKFGAFGFNESLRMELTKKNSRVKTTVICPAFVNTGMFDGYKANNPLAPALSPVQVAKAVVQAVKKDRPEVSLPTSSILLYILRLLPVFIFDYILNLLGVNNAMDTYKGRGRNWSLERLDKPAILDSSKADEKKKTK